VRAVNLLPEKHRPRRATGQQQGSAYAVLGVLGVLLVAVLCYVLTLNSINTKRDATSRAKAEAAKSEAQAKSLSAYGNFSQIKEERVQSVQQLAEGRFDWERRVREVAHVLPEDVWLLSSDASATPTTTGGAASTPAPGAAGGGPTVKLIGCARSQSEVAVTLVRLRSMEGAVDVKLNQSQQPDEQSGGAAPAATAGDTGASGDSCGQTGGDPNFKFEAEVSFEAPAPTTGGSPETVEVPARLGGGS
jgi:Tfp pilus assembly protein PilN